MCGPTIKSHLLWTGCEERDFFFDNYWSESI